MVFARFDGFSSSCAVVAAYRHAKGSGVLALDLGGFASGVALQCAVDSSPKKSDLNRINGKFGF